MIQKRFDGSIDFDRNWADYKNGFGDVCGEYWLGNDVIHQLTSHFNYTLKIVLTDWDNVTKFILYTLFRVANEGDDYRLTLGAYNNTGNAGDSLSLHNGKPFSTPDRDNDDSGSKNCAAVHDGAWWFHSCMDSNLNGRYHFGPRERCTNGIYWISFHRMACLKAATMMIKKI